MFAKRVSYYRLVFLLVVIVGALMFRLWDLEKRIFWNVDQSLVIWQVKTVLVDHKISLIGQHFFSLVSGAVYRTSFYNWVYAVYFWLVGFSVTNWAVSYAVWAIVSMIALAQVAYRIAGEMAWKLTLVLYAFSWFLARTEMVLWHVSLMIVLTSIVLGFEFGGKQKFSFWKKFLTGIILGLGFSLHFVVIWLIGGLFIYWLVADRDRLLLKFFAASLGIGLMLMPLVIFNFRHEFIMSKGVVNMLTGSAVEDAASFNQRVEIADSTFSTMVSELVTIGETTSVQTVELFVVIVLLLFLFGKKITKKYSLFVLIQILVAVFGLMFAGRVSYSSQHYIIYLLPMLVLAMALVLTMVAKTRAWPLVLVLVGFYVVTNSQRFLAYQDNNSYYYKRTLARYLYSVETDDRAGVRFWDQETLAYDFVFWEAARDLGLEYGQVNMIELWGADEADYIVYVNEKPANVGVGNVIEFGRSKLLKPKETSRM